MSNVLFMLSHYDFWYNVLLGTTYYLLFHRIVNYKPSKKDVIGSILFVLLCSIFLYVSKGLIFEPVRRLTAIMLPGIYLGYMTKTSKTLSFSVVFMIYLMAMIVSFTTYILINAIGQFFIPFLYYSGNETYGTQQNIIKLLSIPAQFTLNYCIYKWGDLGRMKSLLENLWLQRTLCLLTAMYLFLLCYSAIITLQLETLVLLAVSLVFIIITTIMVAKSMHDRADEKRKYQLELHNVTISTQKIEQKLKKFEEARNELKAEKSQNHKYKDIIPALASDTQVLLDSINALKAPNSREKTKIESIGRRLNFILNMAIESADEMHVDKVKSIINVYQTSWSGLNIYFAECYKRAKDEDVFFTLQVNDDVSYIEKMGKGTVKVFRTICYLINNAFAELLKTESENKIIIAILGLKNGKYEIEIRDNAHEFDERVLANLGVRGNSTNGTGDGYADIFEMLELYKASLVIVERQPCGGMPMKSIKIVFDGKNERIIESYRSVALKEALKGSSLVVKNHKEKQNSEEVFEKAAPNLMV